MQLGLKYSFIVGLVVSLNGCGFFSLKDRPSPLSPSSTIQTQIQDHSKGLVRLKSECFQKAPEDCLGGYGFVIDGDGKYQVGPGPENQHFSGQLEGYEMNVLREELANVKPEVESTSMRLEVCQSLSDLSNEGHDLQIAKDTVSIQLKAQSIDLLKVIDQDFCYHSMSSENARNLYVFLRRLVLKYYPLPFPQDSCREAVSKLTNIYNEVQKCRTDQECEYISEENEVISGENLSFVLVNDCSPVKPLIFGNPDEVLRRRPELNEKQEAARSACRNISPPVSCKGFMNVLTNPHPACRFGKCHAKKNG